MKRTLPLLSLFLILSVSSFSQDHKVYDDGISRFKSGDYQGVIDLFTRLLDDPSHNKRFNEDLYFYRGQAYFHTGKWDAAIIDMDESLKLNHFNKAEIYWVKARCEDKLGKPAQAEADYKDALAHGEKNKKITARILADRASYYTRQGNKVAAQEDLNKARSLDPSNKDLTKVNPDTQQKSVAKNDEAKNTKVIVKSNTPAQKDNQSVPVKETPKPAGNDTKEKPSQTVKENNSAAMVSAIAEVYRDEKRFALVIGNSNYSKDIGILKNPVNDATDVATELRKSNFEVQLLTNATYIQIREAMRKFQENLSNGPRDQTVGLFYYAGHGVQYQDENYLVPIDANVKFEDDIVRMCFPVQRMVLNNMENTNSRMNIIILDACRNNPFPATTRSVSHGLGEMKRARGSFIAYATAPGSVASDGQGRNGLYTQELLKALRKQGLTIEQVFKEVRMNVLRLSGEKQYTWDSSNIIGEFYFKF